MNPFSFLNNIGSNLAQYFQPAANQVKNVFDQFSGLFGNQSLISPLPDEPKPVKLNPTVTMSNRVPPSSPAPTQTPQVPPISQIGQNGTPITADQILSGFNRFAPDTPAATQSAEFAKLGQSMPQGIDQLLPAILSLMETGGGKHTVGSNNWLNVRGSQGGKTQFINYPDLNTALFGGQNGPDVSGGFSGLINSPTYSDFRQSGKLEDFFKHYTPPGEGNPSLQELLDRYNTLRMLFGG